MSRLLRIAEMAGRDQRPDRIVLGSLCCPDHLFGVGLLDAFHRLSPRFVGLVCGRGRRFHGPLGHLLVALGSRFRSYFVAVRLYGLAGGVDACVGAYQNTNYFCGRAEAEENCKGFQHRSLLSVPFLCPKRCRSFAVVICSEGFV